MANNKSLFWWILSIIIAVVICSVVFFMTSNARKKLPAQYNFADTLETKVKIILPDTLSYVNYFINMEYNNVDSINVSDKGIAEAIIKTPAFAYISLFYGNEIIGMLIADGKVVELDLVNNKIKSSQLNKKFFSQREIEKKRYIEPLNNLYTEYFSIEEDSLEKRSEVEKKIDILDKEYSHYISEFAKKNKGNILPAYAISQVFYSYNYEELSVVLDSSAVYFSHPMLNQAKGHLSGLYKRRNGIMFTDMNMKDTEGNQVSLSQWAGQGNYVFVDFWASWCAPCRGELPNILDVYNKYHIKEGFEVVGVSVDQDRNSWVNCIDKFGLPWHHMSELLGRGGQTKEIYGVGAIPCSILLDPTGKIIDSDLRGDELMQRLIEIYGY